MNSFLIVANVYIAASFLTENSRNKMILTVNCVIWLVLGIIEFSTR
jgi:hypothetical protein